MEVHLCQNFSLWISKLLTFNASSLLNGKLLSLEKSVFAHGFVASVCHEVTLGTSQPEGDAKWQTIEFDRSHFRIAVYRVVRSIEFSPTLGMR